MLINELEAVDVSVRGVSAGWMRAMLSSRDEAVTERGCAVELSLNLCYISSAVLQNHLIWFNKLILGHSNVSLCEELLIV